MNTMADGAAKRLVAEMAQILFGQPGLTLMELAEKVKASQPSPTGQGDAQVTDEMVDAACRAYFDTAEDAVAVDHACMEAALRAALDARQPVGQEPVAVLHRVDEYGPVLDWHTHWIELKAGTKLYAAPPSQAVDLGQFRPAVEAFVADAEREVSAHETFWGHAPHFSDENAKRLAEAKRLLALIDSQ